MKIYTGRIESKFTNNTSVNTIEFHGKLESEDSFKSWVFNIEVGLNAKYGKDKYSPEQIEFLKSVFNDSVHVMITKEKI